MCAEQEPPSPHPGLAWQRWRCWGLLETRYNCKTVCNSNVFLGSLWSFPYLFFTSQGVWFFLNSFWHKQTKSCRPPVFTAPPKRLQNGPTSAPQQPPWFCSLLFPHVPASNRPFQERLQFWGHLRALYFIWMCLLGAAVSAAAGIQLPAVQPREFLHRLFIQIANSLHRWLCIRLCGRRVAF